MFTLLDNYKANNIREGIQVHAILERLERFKDLDLIIERLHTEGLIKDDDKQRVQSKVIELFKQPLFKSFFDPHWEVFSEREIACQGKWYQPDRVMVSSNRTVVVDFKREKESSSHHKQVQEYANYLEGMGYENLEMYLVYVSDLRIVQL